MGRARARFGATTVIALAAASLACDRGCEQRTSAAPPSPLATAPALSSVPFKNGPIAPPPAASVAIVAANPNASQSFTTGWAGLEENTWRWSVGDRSRVEIDFRPGDRAYVLALDVAAYPGPGPQSATLKMNDKPLGTVPIKVGWAVTTILVPRGTLVAGTNTLDLAWGWTRAPIDVDKNSKDDRRLAVQIRGLSLAPVPDRAAIDAKDPAVLAALGSGWSGVERADTRAWVWSDDASSVLKFDLSPTAEPYELTLSGISALPSLGVDAKIGGKVVGHGTMDPTTPSCVIPIGAGNLADGANSIELVWSATAVPPGGADKRHLALMLQRAEVAPRVDRDK